MYDIDAGRSHAIRLDSPRASSVDEEIAAIEKQMEALSLRHCELMEAKRVAFAQARPIPASAPVIGEVTRAYQSGDTFTIEMKVDDDILSASNDFWTHRRHVMAGTTPKVARISGEIEDLVSGTTGSLEIAVAEDMNGERARRFFQDMHYRVTGVRRRGEGV